MKAFTKKVLTCRQRSIKNHVSVEGYGGFIKDKATVTFLPALPDSGVVFEFQSGEQLPALHRYVSEHEKYHTTCLKLDESHFILTIEHLLAAVFGLGINNIKVLVPDNGLIPMKDGSAFEFCAALLSTGIVDQPKSRVTAIVPKRRVRFEEDDRYIELDKPSDGCLKIQSVIQFPDPIGIQQLSYSHSAENFCLHLAWARTFAFRSFINKRLTLKKFQGFITDEYFVESNLILWKHREGGKGKWVTHVRKGDEPVRHKTMDFVGDMALLGAPLVANAYLYKPGHTLNRKVVESIMNDLKGS